MQWDVVILVPSIHIYPAIKKDLSNFYMFIFGCEMQWSVVVVVPSIRIHSAIKKNLSNFYESGFGCKMQWSVAIVVPGIWIGAQLEKELSNFKIVSSSPRRPARRLIILALTSRSSAS
jgi:hypothetical protein